MHLAFSPTVWLGVALAGTAVVCLVVSGALRERGRGLAPAKGTARRPGPDRGLPAAERAEPAIDDDLAEIEAILKKRGIS